MPRLGSIQYHPASQICLFSISQPGEAITVVPSRRSKEYAAPATRSPRLTVLERRVAEVEVPARPCRVLLGADGLPQPVKVLPHRVDRCVHIDELGAHVHGLGVLELVGVPGTETAE